MNNKKKQENENQSRLILMKRCKTFETLEANGLLYVDQESSKVVIANTLAALFISSQKKWKAFLQNLEFYVVFKLSYFQAKNHPDATSPINKKDVSQLPVMNFVILNKNGDPVVVGNFKSGKLDMVPYELLVNK